MPTYLVERNLPGFTADQLPAAASAAKRASAELTEDGMPVRYLRSAFVPGEEKCMCLFEAASPEQVQQANERAGLPFVRIVDAAAITTDDV
jgi:hypothetical protein